MNYTLGVDIGTFESKGVLADGTGRIIATASRPHEMIVPRPGWAEHRAEEDWWGDFVAITRDILAASEIDPSDITAIACSGIGPCMLPVDADCTPLMNAVLYGVDTRATEEVEQINGAIGEEMLLDRCGNALTSQSVGPKILWLRNNRPEIYARTAKILTCTSYLVMKLTGNPVIDHFTAANFAPLYDVDRLHWTDELMPAILPLDKLPRLLWSFQIAGAVTPGAAAETGLTVGTPVTCGTIDAAAEAVSVGVHQPGDMMMMYGSTIFMVALTRTRLRDPALWYAPWLFPGQHASMAGLATSGTLTHWFRDQFARELPRDEAFPALASEAEASVPGARGLLMLPYFSGERTPIHDPKARGAFFGLNLTHTRGDMYRALIEGIAYGSRHAMDTLARAGQPPERVLAVGGGVKNPLWLQATSDISGLNQSLCKTMLGACYGNAFLAAVAAGAAAPEDIRKWNPIESEVVAGYHPTYVRHYDLFRQLYEQTRDIAHKLSDEAC